MTEETELLHSTKASEVNENLPIESHEGRVHLFSSRIEVAKTD